MSFVMASLEDQLDQALALGALQEALQLAQRAERQFPESARVRHRHGLALLQLKRPHEAFIKFTEAIRLHPLSIDVRMALAQAYLSMNDSWSAAAWVSDACRVAPQLPALWLQLARLLQAQRRSAEIEPTLRAALLANPHHRVLLQALAEHLLQRQRHGAALPIYQELVSIDPGNARHRLHHGYCHEYAQQLEQAVAEYRAAIELQPEFLEAHVDLAGVLWRLGDYDGSLRHAQRAIAIDPDHPYAVRIMGTALLHLNRLDEAQVHLRRALVLKPQFPIALVDLALLLLLDGQFEEGWQVYGRRWTDTERMKRPAFFRPELEWRGLQAQPVAGKRIVIYAEQGLGDVIQFVRYALVLQQHGAKVSCVLQPELVSLVESMPGVVCLKPDNMIEADHHVALLDLPLHFHTDLKSLPAPVGYLSAQPDRQTTWAARLARWQDRLRIGIAWAGHAIHPNHHNRSMPLSEFRALMRHPGVQCFSLQKSDGERYTDLAYDEADLIDFTSDWRDFADSAALVSQLDLVITIDSAVAHLAAALGRPVWLLLPPNPDWRWLLERSDSPWYPTMRLFRRAHGEPRERQMARVLVALEELLQQRAAAAPASPA